MSLILSCDYIVLMTSYHITGFFSRETAFANWVRIQSKEAEFWIIILFLNYWLLQFLSVICIFHPYLKNRLFLRLFFSWDSVIKLNGSRVPYSRYPVHRYHSTSQEEEARHKQNRRQPLKMKVVYQEYQFISW